MTTGYSGTPLIKKLGINAGFRVMLLHEPKDYMDLLGPLAADVMLFHTFTAGAGMCDFVHAFYTERARLSMEFAALKAALKPAGLLWLSWPKQAAKVPTDLNREAIRELGLAGGLVDVKVGAINAIWSGLKFVYRTVDR